MGWLGGNFQTQKSLTPEIRYTLKISHSGLWLGAYSHYQKQLFDRVYLLRNTKGLTFNAIADTLIAEGYKAPRGGLLGAENVFSIFKKGLRRASRLNAPTKLEICSIEVLALPASDRPIESKDTAAMALMDKLCKVKAAK